MPHSEYNASRTEPVHFLQIWIIPERERLAPGYEQKVFPAEERQGTLRLVGSRDGREGSVTIHQDVDLYAGRLAQGEAASFALRPGRQAWLQVARGRLELNGRHLATGDGAAVNGEDELRNKGVDDAELLLFDLAA